MLKIRPEVLTDPSDIHRVHTLAFERPNEAAFVDALRRDGILTVSLVAEQAQHMVGHIAFSPVTIISNMTTIEAIGLGPVAVLPDYQRQGIGSQLVHRASAFNLSHQHL
ncbi:hypothetical protein C2W62_27400 [Candidatus Entotheonella serta]|nr:hypothetical protein C2W62_27400 [Candidatus Entotheonella serta]